MSIPFFLKKLKKIVCFSPENCYKIILLFHNYTFYFWITGRSLKKMNKSKQLVILLSILALLILLAVWQKRDVLFKNQQATEQSQLLFPDFDQQAASQIKLTKPDQETILVKQDNRWLVSTASNIPADPESVTNLLDQITRIKKGDLISQQPEKFGQFQVDDSGLLVEVTDEKEKSLVSFYVGKLGSDFDSFYLRSAGNNDVLLINKNLRPIFYRSDWRKKTVFDFDADEVQDLTLEYDDQRFRLTKQGEDWQLIQPEEAAAQNRTVNAILNTLNRLRIDDYVEDQQELSQYGLDKPWFKIKATLVYGTDLSLWAGNKKEAAKVYYAKQEDEEYIFTLSANQVDNMKKKLSDLKQEEKASPGSKADAEKDKPENH
jgi:hypothetical protein